MRALFRVLFASVLLSLLAPPPFVRGATYAYIPSFGNNSVTRVNTSDGTFAPPYAFSRENISCSPYGAAVASDGSFVIVTCGGVNQNQVAFLSDSQFGSDPPKPDMLEVGLRPRGVAIAPGGKYAYVANSGSDSNSNDKSVSIIDTATRAVVATIPIADASDPFSSGDAPWGIAAVDIGTTNKAYVGNYVNDSVSVITYDSSGARVTKVINNLGGRPAGLAAAPDGSKVYVALNTTGYLRVIRTSDDTLLSTAVPTGQFPWGVAVGSRGRYAYVSSSDLLSNSVTVIRLSDSTVVGTVGAGAGIGTRPFGIAAALNGEFAYAVSQGISSSDPGTITRVRLTNGLPAGAQLSMPSPNPLQGPFALGTFIGGPAPNAPSNLQGSAGDYDRIDLTWADNSNDEIGFLIERREKGDEAYSEIAQTAAGATSYSDTSLASETPYQYRIRAMNETGYSAFADSSDITTPEGNFHWCFIGTLISDFFRK